VCVCRRRKSLYECKKRVCKREGRETCCINVPFFNELKNVFFFPTTFLPSTPSRPCCVFSYALYWKFDFPRKMKRKCELPRIPGLTQIKQLSFKHFLQTLNVDHQPRTIQLFRLTWTIDYRTWSNFHLVSESNYLIT